MRYQNMKLSVVAALAFGAVATVHGSYGGEQGGKSEGVKAEQGYSSESQQAAAPANPGEKDTSDIMVISQNWGDQKGCQQMNTASSGGKVHEVIVGGSAGLVYTPDTINAAVGDKVHFTFMQQNHTVTQSSFEKPCVKLDKAVDSGFMPNPNNTLSPAPTFMFEVKTTAATWFYCKQKTGSHCGKGMVFSINPTAEKSHDTFKQMAMQQNGTAPDAAAASSSSASVVESTSSWTSTATAAGDAAASSSTWAATYDSASSWTSTATAAGEGATSSSTWVDTTSSWSTTAATAAATEVPAATGGSQVVPGTGSNGNGDACSCSCLCGVGTFPQGAGVGSWGGYGGAMAAPWGAAAMASSGAAAPAYR